MPLSQIAQKIERAFGLVLVPEIDDVKLVVRLTLEQPPLGAGPEHLRESFTTVAAGQQEEKPEDFRRRRRDVGIVAIHANPEVGVVEPGIERQGAFECILNPLPVARSRQPLFTQHAPLDARGIRSAEVEPRFGIIRRANRPGFGRADGAFDGGRELVVERAAVGVELDAPPERRGVEHVTGLDWSRPARAPEFGLELAESRIEDEVVRADEPSFAADDRSGRVL